MSIKWMPELKVKRFLQQTIGMIVLCWLGVSHAQTAGEDGLGQTVQIMTYFRSVVDSPSLLLIIRDVDHNQNIPYVFNLAAGEHNWLAFTYSRNYLILAANVHMHTYDAYSNQYKIHRIANFCHLESRGRIVRGKSMFVRVIGRLRPYGQDYTCHISAYPD